MGKLILVVDSQIGVCQSSKEYLEAAGYAVQVVSPGDVVSEARSSRPSLILIPLLSQPRAGLELCQRLHRDPLLTGTAIVCLLDSGTEEHHVSALECGADDCITQPFNPRELVARVQAVLRRSPLSPSAASRDKADLVIDSWAMKVLVRGTEVSTTTLEFRLIEYMARHRGQVLTRDVLLDAVWGDMQFIAPRSVDACIRRIRRKIEPERGKPTLLRTIRGVGYRLDAAAAWRSGSSGSCDCPACRTQASAAQSPLVSASRKRTTA
ncbi:MAG TPA: response regulator transcription factor [Terriglobales bacterium]|nr:response regulator transcription factor [Terriglobales bacterium]